MIDAVKSKLLSRNLHGKHAHSAYNFPGWNMAAGTEAEPVIPSPDDFAWTATENELTNLWAPGLQVNSLDVLVNNVDMES